jgi:outer membrane protein TolC
MSKQKIFSSAAAVIVLASVAGCNLEPQRPFDPRLWTADERTASSERSSAKLYPLPTTLQSPFLPNSDNSQPSGQPVENVTVIKEPVVRLSLREIVQRAVANNYDVKVAGYNPAIDATRTVEAESRFDPVFFTNAQYQHTDNRTAGTTIFNPTTFLNEVVNFNESDVYTVSTGVRQNLTTGAQIELRHQIEQTNLDPKTFTTNPYWESEIVLQITQPLLRNFGTEVNRARIVISQNNQQISLLEFRKQLEQTTANIESTYWQLVNAVENVRISEELLQRTVDTADILWKRRNQDVTRVQLSQANASIEARRATLIRARAKVRDLSDQLKQLMNDPSLPIAAKTLILPDSEPLEEPIKFDPREQFESAMRNRFELAEQQLRIGNAGITVNAARNNLLPQLNLIGSVGGQGLDGDLGDAYDNLFTDTHFSYGVGLQFEVPIGNREARAIYRRTMLQRQQAIDQYKQLIDQISLDVSTALREVETTWQEMSATRKARFAAADELLAIQQRKENQEPLTPTFVQLELDAQSRLATAQLSEAQAIANYNTAIARLEFAKGTLLRYNNIIMEEAPLVRDNPDK